VEIRTSVATCWFILVIGIEIVRSLFTEPYRASLQDVFEVAAKFAKTFKKKKTLHTFHKRRNPLNNYCEVRATEQRTR